MSGNREEAMRLRMRMMGGDLPVTQFLDLWRKSGDIRFFAKSTRGHFLSVSPNLLELNGLAREEDMVGLTDHDLYPNSIAEKFVQDDGSVMAAVSPMTDILEIFLDRKGIPDWYLTHKYPIRSRSGQVLGVMGTSSKYSGAAAEANPCPSLNLAVRHMQNHFAEDLSIPLLADKVHLSVRQFQRAFQHHFKMPPSRYLTRMRILAACDALADGLRPVAEISGAVGFGDESHFGRQFKRHIGVTPLQYRRRGA